MFVIKILGLMDLLTAIVMVLLQFDLIGWRLGFSFACYLLMKAFLWRGDIASFIDMFAALAIVLLIFHIHTVLTFIFAAYILQKAIFSLI